MQAYPKHTTFALKFCKVGKHNMKEKEDYAFMDSSFPTTIVKQSR